MSRTILGLIVASVCLTASEVAYHEQFPDGPNAAAAGWYFHHSAQAWEGTKDDAWGGGPGGNADAAVESDPDDDTALWKGFVWLANGDRYLFWTDERSFKGGTVEQVSWRMSAQDPEGKVHLALRVGGSWFASATPVTLDSKPITAAAAVSVEVAQATWVPFAWTPFQSLPKKLDGAAAALPAGDITAFGFLSTSKNDTHTYDTVMVKTTHGAADIIKAKK